MILCKATYSNIYNHPSLIKDPPRERIRIDKKSGMPLLETVQEEDEDSEDDQMRGTYSFRLVMDVV
jgi:hypothetical protein